MSQITGMFSYRKGAKKVARIRISGPDKKGIIAATTTYLFKNNCNIEDIDQRIREDFLVMNMVVDTSDLKVSLPRFLKGLDETARQVGMGVEFRPEEKRAIKNVAILVTKESHCLVALLEKMKRKKMKGKAGVIIGNHPDLREVAQHYRVPFYHLPSEKRKEHEERISQLLAKFEVDLIVLARYMQVLSPEFNFRYEGKIINIHPSLLPAFPGPRSYHQAFNKGVEVVGVTAHFVTTDLDEGPIITQEAFRVNKTCDTVEKFIARGRGLETRVLTRAVQLFLEDRLTLRRGKVFDSKKQPCMLGEEE